LENGLAKPIILGLGCSTVVASKVEVSFATSITSVVSTLTNGLEKGLANPTIFGLGSSVPV